MKKHKCDDCKFIHKFLDSSQREITICTFDESDYYLQEVGHCDYCELDDFAEEEWQEENEEEREDNA